MVQLVGRLRTPFKHRSLALPEHVPCGVHDVCALCALVRSIVGCHEDNGVFVHPPSGNSGTNHTDTSIHLRQRTEVIRIVLVPNAPFEDCR